MYLAEGLHLVDLAGRELLLFAGVWFAVGLVDELAIDLLWLSLRFTGRCKTLHFSPLTIDRLRGPAAVLIPCWNEAEVIQPMIACTRRAWPHDACRIYVGCYRNDPATLAAAMRGAERDHRVRVVLVPRDGPTTKADCLNALYDALTRDERDTGRPYRFVVLHDAEDHVHPLALDLIDAELERADFVQLPVVPELNEQSRWISGHYSDEFAENHSKALVVRDWLGTALPAAGVGCAFGRDMLTRIAERRGEEHPFAADSLTEDYELGLLVQELGGRGSFVRAVDPSGNLIATRAFFPTTIRASVRQKARWLHGIAFQSWERLGWARSLPEVWMRARDRRGPLTAMILLAAYLSIICWAVAFTGRRFDLIDPLPPSNLMNAVIVVGFIGLVWRALMRFAFTTSLYGWSEGARGVARLPIGNVIAIVAARRALAAYVRTLRGQRAIWDKTHHDRHPSIHATSEAS